MWHECSLFFPRPDRLVPRRWSRASGPQYGCPGSALRGGGPRSSAVHFELLAFAASSGPENPER
eukprot:3407592-Pyramimonas_sp.AAC.1